MALRNQPYIPLYVQDFLTDEKLMECSALANGVYIRLMCVMHKSECYGTILLKQKDKQNNKQVINFAYKLAKFLPWDLQTIVIGIEELLEEKVISIEGDSLSQKRMVKDGIISDKRALAGSRGGNNSLGKPNKTPKKFAQAKHQANSEIENENEIEIEDKNKSVVVKKEKEVSKKIEIIYPFPTEKLKVQWQLWKTYKSKEHNFKYKSELSEQASLNELHNLSGGDESKAIAIMNQSMTKGWKGFFELINSGNGKKQSDNGATRVSYSDDFQRKIVEGLQS